MKLITNTYRKETGKSPYKHNLFGKRIFNPEYNNWLENKVTKMIPIIEDENIKLKKINKIFESSNQILEDRIRILTKKNKELIEQLDASSTRTKLSFKDCEKLLFYGKLKDKSIVIDKNEKHLDFFIENLFEMAKEKTKFDSNKAIKIFWNRIVALANYY